MRATYWGAEVPAHLVGPEDEDSLVRLDRYVKNFDYRTRTFPPDPDALALSFADVLDREVRACFEDVRFVGEKYTQQIRVEAGSMRPQWIEPPKVPDELLGLQNIVDEFCAQHLQPRLLFPPSTQETPMPAIDNTPGQVRQYKPGTDECYPTPEHPKTTLKRLRKQAKFIRKEIAAVQKRAKRNAKYEAIALTKAKQARRDHKLAMWSLREIVANPAKHDAAARVTAAESLINHAYGD